jgi:hypothetical protein
VFLPTYLTRLVLHTQAARNQAEAMERNERLAGAMQAESAAMAESQGGSQPGRAALAPASAPPAARSKPQGDLGAAAMVSEPQETDTPAVPLFQHLQHPLLPGYFDARLKPHQVRASSAMPIDVAITAPFTYQPAIQRVSCVWSQKGMQ